MASFPGGGHNQGGGQPPGKVRDDRRDNGAALSDNKLPLPCVLIPLSRPEDKLGLSLSRKMSSFGEDGGRIFKHHHRE